MNTWKPLPIWSADADDPDMARIRAAKEALWLDYVVKPQYAEASIEDRVLAWGSAPSFVCPYALVDPRGTDDELMLALAWVLGETDECSVAMTVEQVLSVLLGPGVREIPQEELDAEAAYQAYERGDA